MVNNKLLTR